jgi:hypothetical protein
MKHPGTSALDITGLHPNDTDTGRTNPMSCHPDVPVAIPTLVSANPDIAWSGCDANHAYSNRRRWRNTNHRGLGASNDCSQQQCSAKSDASVVHLMISFRALANECSKSAARLSLLIGARELAELTVTTPKEPCGKVNDSLVRSTQPGILPRRRDVLVVSAKLDVGTVAVAEFQ